MLIWCIFYFLKKEYRLQIFTFNKNKMDILKLSEWISKLNLNDIFKKWHLRIWIEDKTLSINYITPGKEDKTLLSLYPLLLRNIKKEIRGILVDLYYKYERDWQPMTIDDLSKVMGMSIWSTHNILTKILTKIRMIKKVFQDEI